jgi:hypothetical protein
VAEVLIPLQTVFAVAAGDGWLHSNPLPGLEVFDIWPHLADHGGELMPGNVGRQDAAFAHAAIGIPMHVRAAYAHDRRTQENLPRARVAG